MTQQVPATCVLGPGKTGLTVGVTVLNVDGTEYAAFSTTGVAETSVAGTYRKAGGVVCPDAGGYLVWGVSGTDYAEATVDPVGLRPTVAGETVDVSGGAITTVTTLTGHTPQTGDSYARLGAPAGASVSADIAAANASLTTVLARLGAWTGSGVNTVLGAFKALLSKTASAPSDIGGTFDPAVDSVEALRDRGDAAWATADVSGLAQTGADGDTLKSLSDQIDTIDASGTAQAVWEYTTRTLTQSSTSTTDSAAAGSIARRRGDSWSISLTIGAITGYTSLWFTVKHDKDDADSEAILQIKLNSSGTDDDLLYVNGATATDATKGTITVSDDTTGAIIIAVDETVTDDMPVGTFYYDIQALISGAVTTPDSGTFTITADVTRSVT